VYTEGIVGDRGFSESVQPNIYFGQRGGFEHSPPPPNSVHVPDRQKDTTGPAEKNGRGEPFAYT